MMYNWQHKNWPAFTYSKEGLSPFSTAFARELGEASGLLTVLDEGLKQETLIEVLISEAMKTSEIEGEFMSREDVMSSIKRNLGIKTDRTVRDKRVTGAAKLMTMIHQYVAEPLSVDMIKEWHAVLMAGFLKVKAGEWRASDERMQVVSGAWGREVVHFEAPPSSLLSKEMLDFVAWFNRDDIDAPDLMTKALVKTAIAHVYSESIHPFEAGNGRVGRALAEFTLNNTLKSPVLLSISKTIVRNRSGYYAALKEAQAGLDITSWIHYFSNVIIRSQQDAKELIQFTVKKAKFLDLYKERANERQMKVLYRMLENGVDGLVGGMSAKKYMSITKVSKATATRDLNGLYELGAFKKIGAGRSIRYELSIS